MDHKLVGRHLRVLRVLLLHAVARPALLRAEARKVEGSLCGGPASHLWLVGNGGMGTIISTTTTILPFPTNQRVGHVEGLAAELALTWSQFARSRGHGGEGYYEGPHISIV